MNRYLTFNGTNFGYQRIARNTRNQTFHLPKYFNGLLESLEGRFTQDFKSDLNYQLAVL